MWNGPNCLTLATSSFRADCQYLGVPFIFLKTSYMSGKRTGPLPWFGLPFRPVNYYDYYDNQDILKANDVKEKIPDILICFSNASLSM